MSITLGLRTLFLAQPSITAIALPQVVGRQTFPGVFNEYPPIRVVPPFVLIFQTSQDPLVALDGTYGLRSTEFDFDCYSRDYEEAVSLADAVESFIKDYTGAAGPADTIKAVVFEDRAYDEVFEEEGQDIRQHIQSISVTIWHQPTQGV